MSVYIDEKNFFWIVVDRGKLIKNPTEEDLKGTKITSYNKTNICAMCRKDGNITDNSILYPGNVLRDTDKNGKKVYEFVCRTHGEMHYARYNPNSQSNAIKAVRDRRIGNLHDHSQILGDNCEDLTSILFGVKRLSVEYDKYSMLPYDHDPISKHMSITIGDKSEDLYGKILQTKGRCLSYGVWNTRVDGEHDKKVDMLIFYCISIDGKIIERIYIIPKEDILKTTSIHITKNPTDSRGNPITQKYEKYRVIDKDLMRRANDVWRKILEQNRHDDI